MPTQRGTLPADPYADVDFSLSRMSRIYVCLLATVADGRKCCYPIIPEQIDGPAHAAGPEAASSEDGVQRTASLDQDAPLVSDRRLQRGLAVLREERDANRG